jgi:serine/threonine protein kinase/alpha-tubulin suppressor-like RCC1 family protein
MTEPNRCTRCGTALASGARFCSRCGFDVSGEQGGLATAKMTSPVEEDPQAALLEELRRATLGDYEIAAELGRGGMATVYLAHEIALERKVAIKVMSPSLLSGGRSMADRFKREARTAAALSHPHIIPIYGVRESGRLLFFIMKFVQGRSLDAIVKEHGPLPIKMVQAILAQAGSALDYAHRHGIIHRDIKPANIMLDVDGWAVVTDFGIAKVTQSQGLTMTGATIGTPTYMSPEQCAAREITGATDQYSLGIAAYEMITGRVPFDADSVMSLMWQHFHEPPRPILEQRPDCPPDLARAIERMLAKAPADRWATLEEAVEAIGSPAHNDPIRQQMRALARGSGASHVVTEHHTPVSPVPLGTSAPTTPIPQTPAPPPPHMAPMPPPALPVTPLEPISPTSEEFAESPTSVIETPKPATRTPPPPTPPPSARPVAPKPPRRTSGIVSAAKPARAEPAPAIPPPFSAARRGTALRLVGPAAGLVVLGVIGWLVFGRGVEGRQTPTSPASPTAVLVATVAVTPSPAAVAVGKTAQLTAIIKDGRGNLLPGRPVTWTSTDSSMARVSAVGLVTALSPGFVTVTATSEGREGTGTVMITATAAAVASVTLTPRTASIEIGDSAVLAAAPKDDHDNTLAGGGHALIWNTSDRRIATVSPNGTVAALRLGSAVISVLVGGKRDSTRVTVVPPAVAMLTISPPAVPLQVGGRSQLSVAARDAHDRPIEGRHVEWRSNDPAVATVTADGMVTAVRFGQTSITAVMESRSAAAAVTVSAVPVAVVAVTPATLTLAVGKTGQLTAALRDGRGGVLRDRQLQWTSSNPSVASVTPAGVVTAVGAGNATITAASEGETGTAVITVPAPPPATPVVVTPPPIPAGKADSQPVNQPLADPTPPPAAATDEAAARVAPHRGVATGGTHSCGITQSGAVSCWGGNAGAQVSRPTLVSQTTGFSSLSAGVDYTCGLSAGSAICWGANLRGQLGIGKVGPVASATPVVGNHSFTAITAGARHACGLSADGTAWCWGDNNSGQLGIGNTRGSHTPQRVSGGLKFKTLAAGGEHTCGLTDGGKAYCWGDGFSGQLGRGGREVLNQPGPVDAPVKFVAIAAGGAHTCALAQGGKIYCWGANAAGEIGDGSRSERDSPALVSGARTYSAVAAGTGYTCALTDGGEAYCWGRNREGQLGDGSRTDRTTPVRATTDQSLQSISAGGSHSCGVTRDQRVLCWGGNARGQLGDGTQTARLTPAPVESSGSP